MENPVYARQEASASVTSASSSSASLTSSDASATAASTASTAATSTATSSASDSAAVTTDEMSIITTASTSAADESDLVTASTLYTASTLPAGATNIPGSDLRLCTEEAASEQDTFKPFCLPRNGSTKDVGSKYVVSWWPGGFNATGVELRLELQYLNEDYNDVPLSEGRLNATLGFTYMEIDEGMLKGNKENNLTVILWANFPNEPPTEYKGPTITVAQPQPTSPPPPPPNSIDGQDLAIGLPVALAVVCLIVAALFFGFRKHRRIGLGNVMGSKRGYGVGKSRRQRMGKRGPLELGGDAPASEFRDNPTGDVELQNKYRDEGTPRSGGTGENAFRDEIERQRTGRR